MRETFSPGDLAERWACKPDTVLSHIAKGTLKAINIGHGQRKPRWRITQEAVAEFEAKRQRTATQSPLMPRRRRKKTKPEYADYFSL